VDFPHARIAGEQRDLKPEMDRLKSEKRGGRMNGTRRRAEMARDAIWKTLAGGERQKSPREATAIVAAGGFAGWTLAAKENTAEGSLRVELARVRAACGAFESVALGYLALSSAMIFVFSRNLEHPWKLIGAQAIVATIIFLLCAAGARSEERALLNGVTWSARFWHFWRHWYPHLFFLFCFEELAYLVHLVNPNWQDGKLIAFDNWMFGVHPAVWLEQFATPLRNDLLQLAYLTYFVYLLVIGGILYYRREWHAYWSVMTYSAVAYAIGYVIAALFPIQSPWFAMAGMWHGELHGGPFTATINFIEHYGRVRGAAFPSEHVAGAVAVVWGAWRHRRWLFWALLPLVTVMCVSTIWGRYHYVADIFGGIVTGTLGYFIGSWLMNRRSATAQ
jgi:membrane-associated phospholipid phosphatase